MLKKYFYLVLISSLIFQIFLNSCEDSFTTIGSSLLPQGDHLVIKTDTFTNIRLKTVVTDPVKTSKQQSQIIGEYENSFFGISNMSLLCNFIPGSYDTIHKKGYAYKDAYLYLYVDTFYGDNKSSMLFNIYETPVNIHEGKYGIKKSKSYYSNEEYDDYYSTKNLLCNQEVVASNTNNLMRDTTANLYYIKIKMPDMYMQKLENKKDVLYDWYMNNTDTNMTEYQLDSVYSYRDSIYMTLAGGLLIEVQRNNQTEPGTVFNTYLNSLLSVNSTTVLCTRMVIYYEKDDTTTLGSNYYFDPSISNYITNYAIYKNSSEGYPVSSYIDNSTNNDSIAFLSGFGGYNILLQLPDLNNYFKEYNNVIINKAELNIYEADNYKSITDYNSVNRLWLSNSINDLVNINAFYRNRFDPNGFNFNNKYTFSIPYVIQDILNGEMENDLNIYPAYTGRLNSYYSLEYDVHKLNFGVLKNDSISLILTYTLP